MAPPVATALDPGGHGVVVRLVDGPVTVLDTAVPGGTFDPASGTGWKVNRKHTQWTYVGPKGGAGGGIVKVVLADKSARNPGSVAFAITGKAGSYAAGPQVVAELLLPASETCVDAVFPAVRPATPSCKPTRTGLKCK